MSLDTHQFIEFSCQFPVLCFDWVWISVCTAGLLLRHLHHLLVFAQFLVFEYRYTHRQTVDSAIQCVPHLSPQKNKKNIAMTLLLSMHVLRHNKPEQDNTHGTIHVLKFAKEELSLLQTNVNLLKHSSVCVPEIPNLQI